MKTLKMICLAAASLSLCACNNLGTLAGAGNAAASANSALGQFLSDPNCAHHDEATFVTGAGGLPASFQAKVMRDCAARPAGGFMASSATLGSPTTAQPLSGAPTSP